MGDSWENPAVGPEPKLKDAPDNRSYNPGDVRLYGRPIDKSSDRVAAGATELGPDDIFTMRVSTRQIRHDLSIADPAATSELQSIGIIYGYSYEGHCYKLPKPKIMLLPGEPFPLKEAECGFSSKLGYAAWQIDKLERVVMLDVRTDDLKTLLLDENTPGNRSPLAYSQVMALAPHRTRD